jgi:branched-chain amino acid transport system permease protein
MTTAVAAPADTSAHAPERRSPAGIAVRLVILAALAAVVLAIPVLIDAVYVNIVSRAAIYGIVALSMNILLGYTGQVSIGHAAFLGVGAFGAGYALTEMQLPFGAAMVVAALTGAFAALLLGAVALRLAGLYLALVTIAYAQFAQEVLFNIRSLTGGGAGMPAPRPSLLASDLRYAYFCIAILLLVALFDRRLTSSRAGRAIQALRDDERVAASWGVNVTSYKIMAFVISGVIAGIAGALFASTEQIVSKEDFQFSLSLTFLLMTVVGGAGDRLGVIQGGILFAALPTLLDRAHENFHFFPFSEIDALYEPAIAAALLIITLIFTPGGIAQQQGHLRRLLSLKPPKKDHGGPSHLRGGGMGARP